jgi:putative spermidine/putrescine transport system permease protein
MESRGIRIGLRVWTIGLMIFIYAPLVVIVLSAFNASKIPSWPIQDYTTKWFTLAFHDPAARDALQNSVIVALQATAIALILGTAASFALARFNFFGQNTISFILVLPIALPGIVTGLALLSAITYAGITSSLKTVVIGHATFCVVIIYNNVVARLRRSSRSLEEASMDLGADGLRTFRHVMLPNMATALVAGGLLAFALSFDEIVVTLFTAGPQQTLPIWIYNQFRLPNKEPEVNAVAVFVILLTAIPVYFSQRLMRGETGLPTR